ncbi:6187_t:CDS:2 [Diversispora eburnea]|uniref:quinol--cytochrome-c reductase n=1 Tax=Diversispora eburnea TaxID=1213867 RepID=A0A9N8ZNK2_9GLOM|nr:6187_t:CDS:2 [Diversispora eburnea]
MFARISGQVITKKPLKQWVKVVTQFRKASGSASDSKVILKNNKVIAATAAAAAAAGVGYFFIANPIHANMADEGLHAPMYPWPHRGIFSTFDHAREVCSTCHSLDRIAWRNLVGVSHTIEEVKKMAEEFEYKDGPDEEGEYFQRPGRPSDYMPRPYPNDEAARAANAGALPPDLSLMTKARHGGIDYIFSLLTGYVDPPAGVEIREGLNYNPYFPDVATFLSWAAEPEHDDRKKMGVKAIFILSILTGLSIWLKRFRWTTLKSRRIVFAPPTSK